jgi:hypothetical protein
MTNFDRIKKMLNGSTTMPVGTAGESHVHYHDGVACTHDHSHDHDIGPEHDHDHSDHKHHKDGSCCNHGDDCDK